MPAIVKVSVIAARGLPIMDSASKLADAYVELSFGRQQLRRTDVCK